MKAATARLPEFPMIASAPESAIGVEFSAEDQARVRATLAPVAADPAGFARDFYARLFDHSPGLRHLFPTDMATQHKKLSHTLCVIVAGLDDADRLLPTLRALGTAHRRYGAKGAHFLSVGDALIQTLADRNGPGFEGPSRAAWQRLYAWVANVMQAAARH
jgi:hemoglobin-like flavoprotein